MQTGFEFLLEEKLVRKKSKQSFTVDEVGVSRFLEKNGFLYKDDRFYRYDGIGYVPCAREDLERFVFDTIHRNCEGHLENLYRAGKASIKSMIPTFISLYEGKISEVPEDERYRGHLVAFRNGLYNVDTGELLPHTPDVFVVRWLDVDFEPSVEDDAIRKVFRNILPDDREYSIYFTALGKTLFSRTAPTFMTIMYGSFSTGKSFLIHTVEDLCIKNASISMSPSMLNDQCAVAELKDHIANLCWSASLHHRTFGLKWDRLCHILSGEPVMTHLKYRPPMELGNKTPLWFCTEGPLNPSKIPEGVMARTYLVHCKHHQDEGVTREACMNRSELARQWTVNEALKYYLRSLREKCPRAELDSLDQFMIHVTDTCGYKVPERYLIDRALKDVYQSYVSFCEGSLSKDIITQVMTKKMLSKAIVERYDVHRVKKSIRRGDHTTSEIIFGWKWELGEEETQETQESRVHQLDHRVHPRASVSE